MDNIASLDCDAVIRATSAVDSTELRAEVQRYREGEGMPAVRAERCGHQIVVLWRVRDRQRLGWRWVAEATTPASRLAIGLGIRRRPCPDGVRPAARRGETVEAAFKRRAC